MKNLLKKKERKLNKYDHVLSTKKDICKAFIIHHSKQTEENNQGNETTPILDRLSMKNSSMLTPLDLNESIKEEVSDLNDVSKEEIEGEITFDSLPKFTNLKRRSFYHQSSLKNSSQNSVTNPTLVKLDLKCSEQYNKGEFIEKTNKLEFSSCSQFKENTMENHLKRNDSFSTDSTMPDCLTKHPIKNRKGIRHTGVIWKKSAKRLFNEARDSFGNDLSGPEKRHKSTLNAHVFDLSKSEVESKNQTCIPNSSLNRGLPCVANDQENHSENEISLCNLKLQNGICSPCPANETENIVPEDSNKSENIATHLKKITKDTLNHEILNDQELGIILVTSLSSCLGFYPTLLLIGTAGLSIWSSFIHKKNGNLIWQKSSTQETDIFEHFSSRQFCVLGGGSKDQTNFIVAPEPTESGFLNIAVVHHVLTTKDLKLLQSSTSIKICSRCSILGCRSQLWDFHLYIQPCTNESCPNANSSGTLFQISFDMLYSCRTDMWELVLYVNTRIQIGGPLVALNPLWGCGPNPDSNVEDQCMMWQNNSGILGLTDVRGSIKICTSEPDFELKDTLSSGVLIYARVVKEILLLILKIEEICKFLAVNPLTGQFDNFYELKMSELGLSSNSVPSVIYYEGRFIFLTPEAVLITLAVR